MASSAVRFAARRLALLIGAMLLTALVTAGGEARAATAGRWMEITGGRVRLIAEGGPPAADGTIWLGLELALDPGWATYWRNPGDAGIPPEITFSGSLNLGAAEVEFPAPARFDEAGSTVIGYTAPVVLPIRATLADPSLPLSVTAAISLGVCNKICVPVQGETKLSVSAATPRDAETAALIAAARARVPVPSPAGGLALVSAKRAADAPSEIIVTAQLADPASPADLFAEAPAGAYAGLAAAVSREGPAATWRVKVADAAGKPVAGPLSLTLVNGDRAVTASLPVSN